MHPTHLLTRLNGGLLLSGLLTLGAATQARAQSPDLLVVDKVRSNANLPGSLAFVELATGRVLTSIPVGREPHEVAISSDGKIAVVTNTGSYKEPGNSLSVIDVLKREEVHRVELGALWNPHGVFFSQGLFYFTAEGSRALGAYDPVKNEVVWINGTGQDQTHMVIATPDGRRLAATNRGSDTLSLFELKGPNPLQAGVWKETLIPVGHNPEGLDLAPGGKEVWVGCRGANVIDIIDLEQKKVVGSFPTTTKSVARVKFSIDGKWLFASDPFGGDLVIHDAATHEQKAKIHLGAGCEAIFPESDGRHVLVSVTNENTVAEIDLESFAVIRRFDAGAGPDQIAKIPRQP